MRPTAILLLVAMSMAAAMPARADYYIVVGERSRVTAITQQQVLQLFMGRTHFHADGSPAVACEIGRDSLRAGFYRALSGMSLAQVNSYWARLMFSGRSLPPERLPDESALLERLGADPAAIGWLPEVPRQKGLRIVLVLKDAP
jgi:hypothetical protein